MREREGVGGERDLDFFFFTRSKSAVAESKVIREDSSTSYCAYFVHETSGYLSEIGLFQLFRK